MKKMKVTRASDKINKSETCLNCPKENVQLYQIYIRDYIFNLCEKCIQELWVKISDRGDRKEK